MPISVRSTPSVNHYVRFDNATHITLPMDAGTGADADQYTLTDEDIAAASLPEGVYSGVVRKGNYASPLAADEKVAQFTSFVWDGTEEITTGGAGESISFTITNQRT